jgi:enoyl-CoA hydratase/carnithine racemase
VAEDAKLGYPISRNIASPPTHMFTYLMGTQWTRYLLFTGNLIDGKMAPEIGLAWIAFDTEQEAIDIANSTQYGLSGYIQTADLKRALRVAEELVTGEVMINGSPNLFANRPFGGIGLSGLGRGRPLLGRRQNVLP